MSCQKICIGTLDKIIQLVSRTKIPADYGNFDAQIETDVIKEVWANQESISSMSIASSFGIVSFDGDNMNNVLTDIFTIRYIDIDIDITYGVIYNEIFYKILSIQYLNGDNEFLKLFTSRKGKSTIKSNLV